MTDREWAETIVDRHVRNATPEQRECFIAALIAASALLYVDLDALG